MPEPIEDQASSLRRLLGGTMLNSALFVGGDAGIGQTALVAGVAHAFARRGNAVLVIDAQPQLRSGARWFALAPRGDLADVLAGQRRLDEVLLHAAGGVTWVPAAKLRHTDGGPAAGAGAFDPKSADRILVEFGRRFDTVLVDVPADRVGCWWPAAAFAGTVLLGSGEQQRSITAAYSVLKSLTSQVGQRRYLWWMARAADAAAAEASYLKVAQTARRFLHLPIEFAGVVPLDQAVPRSERLRRPLADAFPGSRAAAACAMLADRLDALPRAAEPAEVAWQGLLGLDREAASPPRQTDRGHGQALGRAMKTTSNPTALSASGRTALVSR